MKKLESGQDQLQRICDLLRHDTLEPALAEARRIETEAQHAAQKLLDEANRKASEREAAARRQIQREQEVFQQNVNQALKQAVALLRQEIEQSLFKSSLMAALQGPTSDPTLMAKLVDAMVEALRREGVDVDLNVEVGKTLPPQELINALAPEVRRIVESGKIQTASFPAGVAVTLAGEDVTLDMSEGAIREWLGRFLRKDFRDMLFG